MTVAGTRASEDEEDGAATADTMPDGRAPTSEYPKPVADDALEPWALCNAAASDNVRPNGAPMPMRREPVALTMMKRQATTQPDDEETRTKSNVTCGNPNLA